MNVPYLLAWQKRRPEGAEATSGSLCPATVPNRGFSEKGSYRIEKPSSGASFFVDDELLQEDSSDQRWWLWEPGFFAGCVAAELTDKEGETIARYVLDVSPDPTKLGKDTFATMLRELWKEDPALIAGNEPAISAVGDRGSVDAPWLAFARLRRYGREALQALRAIHQDPRRTLQVRRELVPARSVRRVDRQTAVALRHAPGMLAEVMGLPRGVRSSGVDRFDVPQTEETLDSAANRAMLSLLLRLLRTTHEVKERLAKDVAKERENDTRRRWGRDGRDGWLSWRGWRPR